MNKHHLKSFDLAELGRPDRSRSPRLLKLLDVRPVRPLHEILREEGRPRLLHLHDFPVWVAEGHLLLLALLTLLGLVDEDDLLVLGRVSEGLPHPLLDAPRLRHDLLVGLRLEGAQLEGLARLVVDPEAPVGGQDLLVAPLEAVEL